MRVVAYNNYTVNCVNTEECYLHKIHENTAIHILNLLLGNATRGDMHAFFQWQNLV